MNSKWCEERNRAHISFIPTKNELLIYSNLKIDCDKPSASFIGEKKLLKNARSAKKYSFWPVKNKK